MIKVTNPILQIKDGKNLNHIIAGTVKNGDAEVRVVFKPGAVAVVEGSKMLPGVIPVWVWNNFRDSDVGQNYVKTGRLAVTGDKIASQMVKDYEKATKDDDSSIEATPKTVKPNETGEGIEKP